MKFAFIVTGFIFLQSYWVSDNVDMHESLVLIWTFSNLVIIMSEILFICSPSQPAYHDVLVSDPNSRCQQHTVLVFYLSFQSRFFLYLFLKKSKLGLTSDVCYQRFFTTFFLIHSSITKPD